MPRLFEDEDFGSEDSDYVPPGSGSRKRGSRAQAEAASQPSRSTRAPATVPQYRLFSASETPSFFAPPDVSTPTFAAITRPGHEHLRCTLNHSKFWGCSPQLWNSSASVVNSGASDMDVSRALEIVQLYDAARRAMETSAGVAVVESCSHCIKHQYECKVLVDGSFDTCVGCFVAGAKGKCDHVKKGEDTDSSGDFVDGGAANSPPFFSQDSAGYGDAKPVFSQGQAGVSWDEFMHDVEYASGSAPRSAHHPTLSNANHSTPKRRRRRRHINTATPQKTSNKPLKQYQTPFDLRDKDFRASLGEHQTPVSLISSDEDCYQSPSQSALFTRRATSGSKVKIQSGQEKENTKLKETIKKLEKEKAEFKRQIAELEKAAGETEKERAWRLKRFELYEDLHFAMQCAMKDLRQGLREAHEQFAEYPLATFMLPG